ncbi:MULTISPECIES: LysR family transcriptional regulator ArgP [Vibrio]|uniref:HTH-type transcriptional regulator ArgP n=2 Tax=Vibrio TaxID=662 RepID=A0A7X4LIR8_9VIBR|nr:MULTISPECIES: LysR family transcriptional regulator ArgP [Vibrio]MBF9001416.1 LysR family transcriptional regulator ArgP [Vibrio nitrifigilis]MZI92669.1 ArgP/LysG family DNA-binding transcriptional regulator [Vibrio eleionomae]
MRGLDYKWIEALDSVLSHGSFERAADDLCLSQSAVSQRIKQLEKFLAQPVLIRSAPPQATPIGTKLLGLYRRVSLLEQEVIPELTNHSTLRPINLTIATNADSLATWVLPALKPMMSDNSLALHFAILDENRSIQKMKSGEAVGAISLESQALVGCCAEYLGKMEYLCVASPEFIVRHFAGGVSHDSLLKAPMVSFDQQDEQHKQFLLKHFGITQELFINHKVGSSEAFVEMAKMGIAYCLIPKLQIIQELELGTLVDITPGMSIVNQIYWHHWQLENGILKEISAAIVQGAKEALEQ